MNDVMMMTQRSQQTILGQNRDLKIRKRSIVIIITCRLESKDRRRRRKTLDNAYLRVVTALFLFSLENKKREIRSREKIN